MQSQLYVTARASPEAHPAPPIVARTDERASRLRFSDCLFTPGVHKPTLLWTNCGSLARTFDNHFFECSSCRACIDFRLNGRHRLHVSGQDSTITAAFPHEFASHVARFINAEAAGRLDD